MTRRHDIYITGAGVISALGCGCDEHREALITSRSAIGQLHHLDTDLRDMPCGEVPMSDARLAEMAGAGQPCGRLRNVLLGIIAVNEAAGMAQLNDCDRDRCVFINGTTVGGMDNTERHFGGMLRGDRDARREFAYNSCGACTRLIADATRLRGFASTASTACSSAANAIIMAARMIEAGLCDMAIAGGTESLTRFHLNGFNSLMILDHRRCTPFDVDRRGINLGEGAGYIVLESGASVSRRNAMPLARLAGWGNACDAWHQTATSDNGEGAYRCMSQAIESAGLTPGDITYVNAHGTGTPNNDAGELTAMHRLFGDRMPRFSSTKSLTGHTTSASGGIESVFCILGLLHGFMPAGVPVATPVAGADALLQHTAAVVYDNALCNSFGFGGNDTALIFTRP